MIMTIPHYFWHLVVKNGKFHIITNIYLVKNCQFHIAADMLVA